LFKKKLLIYNFLLQESEHERFIEVILTEKNSPMQYFGKFSLTKTWVKIALKILPKVIAKLCIFHHN